MPTTTMWKLLSLVLVLVLVLASHHLASALMVGDVIDGVEGYILDRYCLDRGTFLDMPDVVAIQFPYKHTLHCLLDPDVCRESVWEVILDPPTPADTGSGSLVEYVRGYTLDQASHDAVVELAKQVGDCDLCTGQGTLVAGFRARMTATVVALTDASDANAGPIITASNVEPVLPADAVMSNSTSVANSEMYQVGDRIDVAGYVMDQYCIHRGTFLDMPDVKSLENPGEHTVHCFVDPDVCRESPYEVLLPPNAGETEYQRAFTLDEPSKEFVLRVLKVVGVCDTCLGTGSLVKGFQAHIKARIVDPMRNATSGAGPVIRLLLADSMLPQETVPTYQVGDPVSIEGFVMDRFCIDRGNFLDEPEIMALEHAELHTAHCLLDPDPCTLTPYEIVLDPRPGEMTYRRAFTLDDDSKTQILALARSECVCESCNDTGRIVRGFRVKVNATIVDPGNIFASGRMLQSTDTVVPPTISVKNVQPVVYLTDSSTAQQVPLQVGDLVTVTGFIMDNFCIAQGFLLDAPDIKPLENPELHTFHCLLDVPMCNSSTYEVLLDPAPGTVPPLYTRVFALDDASRELVQNQAKKVGICDGCSGTGTWKVGFRAKLTGIVVSMGDGADAMPGSDALPVLSVTTAEPSPFVDKSMMMGNDTLSSTMDMNMDMGNTPSQPSALANIDCKTEFQATHIYDGKPLTLSYTVNVDDGTFRGQVVFEGQGWVGFAVSKDGKMVGSNAIIGLPGEPVSQTNPGKYLLGAQAVSGVTLTDQQTLMNANIEQNDTHTVLSFSKLLEEPGEISINPNGMNHFLVAARDLNELEYHTHRIPMEFSLTPCGAEPAASAAADVYNVGDELTVEGFIVDNFCLERGNFVDEPNLMALESPNLHTFHCLLDPQPCVTSPFEVLLDPLPGETMYRRAFTLDDDSKALALALAKELGDCESCTGDKRVERGFRANITATVTALGNTTPTIGVSEITPVFYVTDSSTKVTLQVGDHVTVIGFIMDRFCIDRGTLLDAPTIVTLEEPNLHSVHCLIDVPSCAATNYEVLLDPAPGNESAMYTRGFVLDDAGKALVTAIAKEVGDCSSCSGGGTWKQGFRAKIYGTVEALGQDGDPPQISVRMAEPMPLAAMTADDTTTDAGATDDASQGSAGPVDCTQFQSSKVFDGRGLTLEWVVLVDEATGVGNISAQVTYEGQGWVGFGISKQGGMVGSDAIIGLPDNPVSANNPGKYRLTAQAESGVNLADDQTLLAGNIVQNDTHTVLTFTKVLEEPGDIALMVGPDKTNWFLVAAGSSNTLAQHAQRDFVQVSLAACTPESGGASAITGGGKDPEYSKFAAHGIMATIAWGLFAPVAVGSSLLRHLIPSEGLWFQIHRGLNSLVVLMTIVLFAVVVSAIAESPSPQHFESGPTVIEKHRTIGLVVFILVLIQAIGGYARPHLPAKNDDGSENAPKGAVRILWEFVHKLSGFALLAMAWYQCHSGLKLYARNTGAAEDYIEVFWGVLGAIFGLVFIGLVSRSILPTKKK